ncbi:hypothetical protein ACFOZ7_01130 [Natribaculum luteum]|uniref:Uncharacterized protein n=1 Tax=Natribaculum luteum TaxID=1586232 RepID=A0ABD5NU44_9EURY|nr:hypothetical protein [Natribaculum luteum]
MTGDNDADRRTMGEISHANPYTGETLGQVFSRGPIVAADGGRANAVDAGDETEARSERTMRHVSHTPPDGSEGANRVFERGRVHVSEAEE